VFYGVGGKKRVGRIASPRILEPKFVKTDKRKKIKIRRRNCGVVSVGRG